MHHYSSTQNTLHYNSTLSHTQTVFLIFPFHQTNITSHIWPSGGSGVVQN